MAKCDVGLGPVGAFDRFLSLHRSCLRHASKVVVVHTWRLPHPQSFTYEGVGGQDPPRPPQLVLSCGWR